MIEFKYGKDRWGGFQSVPRYKVSGIWGSIASVGDDSNKEGNFS